MCYQINNVLLFLVKIEANGKFLDCAGTILSPNAVLTSGHCVDGLEPKDVTITHITTTVNTYDARLIIINPKYDRLTLSNDIAVIKIKKQFEKPWMSLKLNENFRETDCAGFQIVGWSITDENLQKATNSSVSLIHKPMTANVKIIPRTECSYLIKTLGGTLEGKEKLCGITNEESEEEHGKCFTGPGGPLLCSLEPKVFTKDIYNKKLILKKKININSNNNTNDNDIVNNGTLSEPIDLLETTIEQKLKNKRNVVVPDEKILQFGVVTWGKSCSKVPSVYVKTEIYNNWIRKAMHGNVKNNVNSTRYELKKSSDECVLPLDRCKGSHVVFKYSFLSPIMAIIVNYVF